MLVVSVLQGEFNLQGRFPEVGDNVKLVPGLFNESLPPFIKSHYKTRHPVDITYLHIDCDLYAGKACTLLTLLTQHCIDLLVILLAIAVITMGLPDVSNNASRPAYNTFEAVLIALPSHETRLVLET